MQQDIDKDMDEEKNKEVLLQPQIEAEARLMAWLNWRVSNTRSEYHEKGH